jgi:hypothetical protein
MAGTVAGRTILTQALHASLLAAVLVGGRPAVAALPNDTASSESAYVKPTASGWTVVPLLTVGDRVGTASYAMVGKPDGLGALAGRMTATGGMTETSRYLTLFMNHELATTRGVARRHGTAGAFVSQWTIDLETLRVTNGSDLIARTLAWANGGWVDRTGTLAFDRLCSADLPKPSALYNPATGRGHKGRMFLNGEETPEGRAFAHLVTGGARGTSYELPHLGKYSHENVLANPASGDRTVVVSLDDDTPGQVYVYFGTKSATGNPVQRAGLAGGRLYGIRVYDGGPRYGYGPAPRENKGAIQGRFDLVDLTPYATGSGASLNSASITSGVTDFARPEDGVWATNNPRVFYWATTGATLDGARQTARLYKLTFDSLWDPSGGTIDLVVDSATLTGTDGQTARGFDNTTFDGAGRIVVQEDGGDNDYIAKTWRIDPVTGSAVQVLESDRSRFTPGAANFLTRKEEHSGVIEITMLVRSASWYQPGRRYYLGTNQAHYWLPGELVEGGQLYLFASPTP